MQNYSFYNPLNFPFISIILDFGQTKINYSTLKSYIFYLLRQTIKEIEIIIYYYYKDMKDIKLISNISNFDKRIKTYISKKKNKIKNFYAIVNIIKGKFILIIQNITEFNNSELEGFFNYTKSGIDNIFNFRLYNKYNLHLIRTKIMKEIVDNEKEFTNFDEIYNYIDLLPKPKITYIPISLSPNNKYAPLAYTSMLSILESKNYFTYIDFYLIIPENFSELNIMLINSLFYQYNFFNITYIHMDERYKNAFVHKYITNQAYYRFSLGTILPNLNKIIYLDADTICLSDLSNFYNLNFNGKIFLGKGLSQNKTFQKQIKINSGILLINLKKMRKMNIEKKVLNILNSGFSHPTLHDQAILELYLYEYVGIFPPKYNSYLLNHTETVKLIKNPKLYDKDELLFSLKYPVIRHYKGAEKNLNDDWYYFARKSKYFQKRSNNYSNIFKFSSL